MQRTPVAVVLAVTIVPGGLSEGMVEPGHPDAIVGLLGHTASGYLMQAPQTPALNV